MNALHVVRRAAAYVWAGPNTLLGLMAGLLVLGLGGRAQLVRGVIEFHGGLMAAFCSALPGPMRFSAITFGHVILGVGAPTLVAVREHEHVHVRQYEAWGPFFLPAYLVSSVWEMLRGRCAYRDNYFERCACSATELPPDDRASGRSAM
ncbi:MAG: signal peptide prediction [Gammaproteobacteria bacterium]